MFMARLPLAAALCAALCLLSTPAHAQWVINELHADPSASAGDANGDGTINTSTDEFVEVVNNTGADVDVGGWTLSDAVGVRHTFPASTVIKNGCAFVVFGGGTPTGSFGGAVVQTASTGQTGFNNSSETITLNDGVSNVATFTWGSETGNDQSVTRDPDISGATPTVLHTVATGSGGTRFSPGTRIDGSQFTGCITDQPPQVSDTNPADDAVNVAVDSNIEIGFNEEVAIATPGDAFSVECPVGNAITFAASASPAIAYTLNPTADLPNGTVCTVTVTATEVLDTDGGDDAMAADFTFDFTTIPANPVVTFTANAVSGAEGDNTTQNIDFVLDITPAPTGALSFSYTLTGSGGNPADAADFGAGASFGGAVVAALDEMTTLPFTIHIPVQGDTAMESDETFTVTLDNFVGADGLQVSPISATGTIVNDDFPIVAIHDIQGAGATSPIAENTQVKVVGAVVTAVTVSPPAAANGFFIQAKDADADANLLTSEGIFVFTGGAPTVSVGNEVSVAGEVAEFFTQTQIDNVVSVPVTNLSVPLPTAVEFSATTGVPSTDPDALSCPGTGPGGTNNVDTNFECFEGMRVSIPNGLVSSPNQRRAADLYAEAYITTTGNRSRREEGLLFGSTPNAGNAAAPIMDGNPEVIEIDADEAGLAITELTAGSTFSAEGVIGFSFGDFEFYPTIYTPDFTAPVPEAVMTPAGGDELTVASFNTQHLCDDDLADDCTRDTLGASGALTYAQKLAKVSDYVRNVLGSPDVIGMQEVDSVTTLQALATQISTDTAGAVQYSAFLVEGDDPGGIDVGFLTRDGRVQDVVIEQFFKGDLWNDPNGPDILHDRPPLLMIANFVGDGVGGLEPFAVINNHTKARSQVDNDTPAAERDRAKRFYQAVDIANLVQQFQTATGPFTGEGTDAIPLILVGDYNAFEYTDGYVDVVGLIAGTYDDAANECEADLSGGAGTETCNLGPNIVDPPLFNTGLAVPANERISYEFTQNYGVVQGANTRDVASVQVIDHILLARNAQGFFLGTDFGIANNAAGVHSGRTDTGPINSSDHDGMVTYLDFDCVNNPELNPDGDMVCGMLDNCPDVANDDQTDTDMDGIGDACELVIGTFFSDGFEEPPTP